MKQRLKNEGFVLRLAMAALLSLTMFGISLFWEGGHSPSWAAPGQNPKIQTVPTRPPHLPPDPSGPPGPPGAPADPAQLPAPSDPAGLSPDTNDVDADEDSAAPGAGGGGAVQNNPEQETPAEANPGDTVQGETAPSEQTVPNAESDSAQSVQAPQTNNENDETIGDGPQADLSLSLALDNSIPSVGQQITLIGILSNGGPDEATNVLIKLAPPGGLILTSALPGAGAYRENQGLWQIEQLAPGESTSLTLVFEVTDARVATILAEVVGVDQFDPDSAPNNNLEIEDDHDSVFLVVNRPDVGPGNSNNLPDITAGLSAISIVSTPTSPGSSLGSMLWIVVFGLGIILILSGIFMVSRA